MRGCSRGCRFCHAGMAYRPVRERAVEEIINSIEIALDQTGFEEVVLLSLSSSDYSHIQELVQKVNERFTGKNLIISLPSLRIESFSVDLIEMLRGARQGGFTLAPEAGSERMRNIINKPITNQQLLDTAREIYNRGWPTIKLYFMIGHPDETLDDVQAIADLCKEVIKVGRATLGNRASLNVGVSTFVPKPHTPFQWIASDSRDAIEAKQSLLRRELKGNGVKLNWTDPCATMLETWLSRGDRRMSGVIYNAWRLGARFDAWQDQFKFSAWDKAFSESGLDPEFYTTRHRNMDEIFPWDHINLNVRKSILAEDYKWSMEGRLRGDCSHHCYACGILPDLTDVRQQYPGDHWRCPEIKSTTKQISFDGP